jgi:hypothetical protein
MTTIHHVPGAILTEREHTVKAIEGEALQLLRRRDRPMVRIVEEQGERRPPDAAAADLADQFRGIPFMHDHDVRAL